MSRPRLWVIFEQSEEAYYCYFPDTYKTVQIPFIYNLSENLSLDYAKRTFPDHEIVVIVD